MSISKAGETLTVEASGDLSGDQFKFMVIDSNGRAARAGDGDRVVGVLQNKPSGLGQAASIWGVGSVSLVIAGEDTVPGVQIGPDANGLAIESGPSPDFVAGISLSQADTGGRLSVWVNNPGVGLVI